jgi:hypothetical protein
VLDPALMTSWPPRPEFVDPIVMEMLPDAPPVAAPTPMFTLPAAPDAVVPVLSMNAPEEPATVDEPVINPTLPVEPLAEPEDNTTPPLEPRLATDVVKASQPVLPDPVVPVTSDILPDTPAVPALAVEILTFPDDVNDDEPLTMNRFPPATPDPREEPADSEILPPSAVEDVPATTLMEPAGPPTAAPVKNTSPPTLPPAFVPVDIAILPLPPVCVLCPVTMLTAPEPVAALPLNS